MVICYLCHGKGKFDAAEIVLKQGRVVLPEMECQQCNGKGYIGAPQMDGYPPVIGSRLDAAADLMAEEINSGNPDIAKCFAVGLKAMKEED